jgi:hypothetical protein
VKKEVISIWICSAICYLLIPCFTFVLPLVFSLKRVSFFAFLLLSMTSGFFIGLFDSSLEPTLHAVIWLLCGAIAYKAETLFFSDKILSIALFSYLVSFLITLLTLVAHRISFNLESAISELIVCPILDTFFCLCYFLIRRLFVLKIKGAH